MKYGIALPYNIALSVPRLATLAEEAGWDGCFLGDAIWCEDPMIVLAAAAMTTSRIRLGTMIVPAPLRQPWKIASESVALDRLSDGRMILGLGVGAVWMGWQAFPDVVTEIKARVEMLDETIEILTLLYQRKPFDFAGEHFQVKLSLLDEVFYPPSPVQQPRIPIWIPGIWPHKKSMTRALKCDGVLLEKQSAKGKPERVTPADVAEIKTFVDENRTLSSPFDIIVSGSTVRMDSEQQQETMASWAKAGATWWIEEMYNEPTDTVADRVHLGPPTVA
jgi:hypothetical protein